MLLFSFVRNEVLRPLKEKLSQLIFIFVRKYTCIKNGRPDKTISATKFLALKSGITLYESKQCWYDRDDSVSKFRIKL